MSEIHETEQPLMSIIIYTEGYVTIVELLERSGHGTTIAYLRPLDGSDEPIGNPKTHSRPFCVVDISSAVIPVLLARPEYGPSAIRWISAALNRMRAMADDRQPENAGYINN